MSIESGAIVPEPARNLPFRGVTRGETESIRFRPQQGIVRVEATRHGIDGDNVAAIWGEDLFHGTVGLVAVATPDQRIIWAPAMNVAHQELYEGFYGPSTSLGDYLAIYTIPKGIKKPRVDIIGLSTNHGEIAESTLAYLKRSLGDRASDVDLSLVLPQTAESDLRYNGPLLAFKF